MATKKTDDLTITIKDGSNLIKELIDAIQANTQAIQCAKVAEIEREIDIRAPKGAPAMREPEVEVPQAPMPTPVQEADATPTAPMSEPKVAQNPFDTQAPAPTQPKVSMDDISRAGAELVDLGKFQQAIGVLQKHGVQSVTQLDPNDYNAVAEEMRALGAHI